MPTLLSLLFILMLAALLLTSIIQERKATATLLKRLALSDQAFDQPQSFIWHTMLDGERVRLRMDCSAEGLAFHLNGAHRRLSFPVRDWRKLRWEELGRTGILTYRLTDDHDKDKTIWLPLEVFDCQDGKHALGWLRRFPAGQR